MVKKRFWYWRILEYDPTPQPNGLYIYNKAETGKTLPPEGKAPNTLKNLCQVTPAIPIQIPIPSGFLPVPNSNGELLEQYAELTQYNNPRPPTPRHNNP